MSDLTQQVSAAPSPSDDPPGQNGETHDDVMSILTGSRMPSDVPQQQVQQQPQTQQRPLAPTQTQTQQPQTQQQPAPGAPAQPGTQQVQQPQAQPGPMAPASQPGPGAADPQLQNTLHRLDQTLNRMGQPQRQGPADPPAYDKVPDYGYNIPAEIIQGLSNEDPAIVTKSLGTLMTGVSRHIHQTVHNNVKEMIRSSLIPYLMNQVREEMTTAEIFRDFYGTYQDLNDPVIRPMIVSVAQQMGQQMPNFAYGPQFKQQLAQAVYARLGKQMPGAQPQAQVQQPVPGSPPAMAPQGTRPMGGRTGPWTEADDIADTILN